MKTLVTLLLPMALFGLWAGNAQAAAQPRLTFDTTALQPRFLVSGTTGTVFTVQSSSDLHVWIPVYADCMNSNLTAFTDPATAQQVRRFYRAVLEAPPLGFPGVGTDRATPFTILQSAVNGIEPGSSVVARFFDNLGFTAEVPALEVTSNGVSFVVPPYLHPQSNEVQESTVHIQVLQKSPAGERISGTIRDFRIQDLPSPAGAPGSIFANFLEGNLERAQTLLTDITGTALDTPGIRQTLSDLITRLGSLLDDVRSVSKAPATSREIGWVSDQRVQLNASVLRNLDRMILGFLAAQAGVTTRAALAGTTQSGVCGQAEAGAYMNALLADPGSANNARSAYHASPLNCTAQTFGKGYRVVVGGGTVAVALASLAGLPAEATALASAALLYVTVEGGAGLIALSGALGQQTAGAKQMLQEGVGMLDDVLKGPLKSLLGEMSGAVLDLASGVQSLHEAFAKANLGPAVTPGVAPASFSLGRVGGCPGGSLSGTIQVTAPAGVTWTASNWDATGDTILEFSPQQGTGSGACSFKIIALPQSPTPGFSCDMISVFDFLNTVDFRFSNGAFYSVELYYQYVLVL